MAGKRIYITVPTRDWALIRRTAALGQQCQGEWCRDAVLLRLYALLQTDVELQEYDAQLSREEREKVLRGR